MIMAQNKDNENTQNKNNDEVEFDLSRVDNTPLLEAIARLRAGYSDEARDEVIRTAIFNATYFVPAVFDQTTEMVQGEDNRIEVEERPKAQFILIQNPDGDKYLPAFTSHDDVEKFGKEQGTPCEAFMMRFSNLAEILEPQDEIKGFVINPFEQNLPFITPFIRSLRQTLTQQMKNMQDKPDITMTTSNDK